MVTGWLTWAVLLLAPNGPTDDVIYMNQRNFQIPIRIAADRQADVKELILYMSQDKGQSWGIHSRAPRDKKAFDIYAQKDGPMWFSIAVVDQNDRADPPDPYKVAPGQKLFIDTAKPEVRIVSAERVGNEIDIRWEARDANPDWATLHLDYRLGDSPGGQPVPVPIQPGDQGTYRLKVAGPGPVTLRLQLKDLAGNEGVDEKVVPADRSLLDRSVVSAGGVDPGGIRTAAGTTQAGAASATSAPITPIASPGASGGSGVPASPVAQSGSPASTAPGAPAVANRLGALPPLRIVNKKQVKLDFEVTEYGPSGLGSVDVFVTTDEGATWELTKPEPGSVLPVSGEVRGSAPLVGSVAVMLPRDGVIYGFYLVVKSRAGIGQEPPRSGDTPQLRLELDTTPPKAEMYAPQPEPGRSDALNLTWWAEDRNMATNPVTLEWSAQREGPWEFIGQPQLPNTGKFTWQVPAKIPPKVFLRLTARDTAGNTAIAQTPEPVVIDLSRPKVGAIKVH
jgi:hypothetical protein